MSLQDINLWTQLWHNMSSRFGKNFQLQMPFSSYNWEDPPPGFIDYRSYSIFNQMPAWSEVGRHSVEGVGIYEAYGVVIQQTPKFVATPTQQQKLEDVQEQITDAQGKREKKVNDSYDKFGEAKKKASAAGKELDYTQWKVDSGWEVILAENAALINKLVIKKAEIIDQYPDNKKVVEEYSPPDHSATTTDKAFVKCNISGNPYWRAVFKAPTPQGVLQHFSVLHHLAPKAEAKMLTFSMDSLKPIDTSSIRSSAMNISNWAQGMGGWEGRERRMRREGRAEPAQYFFRTYVGNSWQKLDFPAQGENVKLSIKIHKLDKFAIHHGHWYDTRYLVDLSKNNSWTEPYTTDKVFGKDGILPLIDTHFIAVLGMKLSVEVPRLSSFQLHEFMTASGVQIGSFRFGGDSDVTRDQWKRSVQNSCLTVEVTDKVPYIVGYLVANADGSEVSK